MASGISSLLCVQESSVQHEKRSGTRPFLVFELTITYQYLLILLPLSILYTLGSDKNSLVAKIYP